MPLRVLLWHPQDAHIPGGHVVQLDKTAQSLRSLGVEVQQCDSPTPSTLDVDLVHGFALSAHQVRRVRGARIPVVLSTIWWDLSYRQGLHEPINLRSLPGRLRTSGSLALAALRRRHHQAAARLNAYRDAAALAFESADLLLPNSEGEARSIQRDLGVSTPYHVVPNAADEKIFTPPTSDVTRHGVVMAGRLEPHKNQLGLIRALRGTGIRLTFVGADHPHHHEYARRVRKAAGNEVEVLGPQQHDDLAAIMRRHRVHALPSRFETTGLVSLEAGLTGCALVSTDRGHAAEYFDSFAWYCDPYDVRSIRTAVLAAYEAPPSDDLRVHILSYYTWRHTAQATMAGYMKALATRGKCPPSA